MSKTLRPKQQMIIVKYGKKMQKLINVKDCLKGYELRDIIGEGGWGTVYQGCKYKDDCDYAIKIMGAPNDYTKEEKAALQEDINKEIKVSELLSANGVGPRFIGAWTCAEGITLLVTERWDGTLDTNKCIDKQMLKKLAEQIETMHKLGYVHGDILEKNILVKYAPSSDSANKNIIDITLSDFGSTVTIEEWKAFEEETETITKFLEYYALNKSTSMYYEQNIITLKQVKEDPRYLDKALIWFLYLLCDNQEKEETPASPKRKRKKSDSNSDSDRK